MYDLDLAQIEKEAMYDGFYAVVTNLEGDISEIIRINQQRWEIEENFRIMKDEPLLPSGICPPGRSYQSALHDLLYQPDFISAFREENRERIYV